MKPLSLALCSVLAVGTSAYPGMQKAVDDIKSLLRSRETDSQFDSFELVGDLRPGYNGGKGGPTSQTGRDVYSILTGDGDPESSTQWSGLLPLPGTAKCKADTCCIWRHIALDMETRFRGLSGRCTGEARAAVRLGFHDAGTWSKFTDDYGGADGSIILSGLQGKPAELKRPENNGLQAISELTTAWYNKYKRYGVGMADLIQMGANVATVVCPLGPRVRSFVGRIDSSTPAVDGLLPNVFSDADTLISLFENKTIRPHGLTALVGAHTTSQQQFVDGSRAGDPQDSTPGVWDVAFYSETTGSAPRRVFKFPSDVVLSQHPSIRDEWNEFAKEQSHWNEDYAREYIRLSLLGVNNINSLTECSHVLPQRTEVLKLTDNKSLLQKWLNSVGSSSISATIEAGGVLGLSVSLGGLLGKSA